MIPRKDRLVALRFQEKPARSNGCVDVLRPSTAKSRCRMNSAADTIMAVSTVSIQFGTRKRRVILLGAGFSSIVPSLFPLLEKKGYRVTDWIGSLIAFSGGVVEVLTPFLISWLIDDHPFVLVYLTFASVVCSFTMFAVMQMFIKLHKRYRRITIESQ